MESGVDRDMLERLLDAQEKLIDGANDNIKRVEDDSRRRDADFSERMRATEERIDRRVSDVESRVDRRMGEGEQRMLEALKRQGEQTTQQIDSLRVLISEDREAAKKARAEELALAEKRLELLVAAAIGKARKQWLHDQKPASVHAIVKSAAHWLALGALTALALLSGHPEILKGLSL